MSQGQTSVLTDNTAAVAGMIADDVPRDIISPLAAEDLEMGVVVRFKTGTNTVEVPKDDTLNIAGVTCFDGMTMQGYPASDGGKVIKAGMPVAVMRRGRVWAQWDGGGTISQMGQVANVCDAAGTVADQGKVTATATSSNAVRAANLRFFRLPATDVGPDGTQKIVKVEVNI